MGRGGEQRYTKKLFTGRLNRLFIGWGVLNMDKAAHAAHKAEASMAERLEQAEQKAVAAHVAESIMASGGKET